ncbi:hypothetical protein SCLCIDRAFT_300012 [Scleroderma citrinum Foug A]|uniref:Secreted protein n=1 Tax=Scleroderma citrinum Foug A TaxID=1036808 RepID=A0A0C2ZS89_9AGAM|nr:hypothetical protein SCLCIDRAFT_300012 [Scleroderma citrinum Foug A]
MQDKWRWAVVFLVKFSNTVESQALRVSKDGRPACSCAVDLQNIGANVLPIWFRFFRVNLISVQLIRLFESAS